MYRKVPLVVKVTLFVCTLFASSALAFGEDKAGLNPDQPIYLNWTFWTAALALIAVVLSQLPPVRVLARRTKVLLEPYSFLQVTEAFGNPNVNLHVHLTNAGGRDVTIHSLNLTLKGEDGQFELPARTFTAPGGQGDRLFTRFVLKPGGEWGNIVNFHKPFSAGDERELRQLIKDLKATINKALVERSAEELEKKELVEAPPGKVTPLLEFFAHHNRWRAGEYEATIRVECKPTKTSASRYFRFTLFEADVHDLTKERTEKYKYGFGVYIPDKDRMEVRPQIKDLR